MPRVAVAQVPRRWPFRLAVAAALVALHLFAIARMAEKELELPFLRPGASAPAFIDRAGALSPTNPLDWDRLVVSRWDSLHYIGTALRGFENCPRQDLRGEALWKLVERCDFSFYPGYALTGRAIAAATSEPVDYALFAVSLTACLVAFFLWTDRTIVAALGPSNAYASLLLLSAFPTASVLVTLHTESLTLALTLGAAVTLARKRYLAAGLLAGAASGVRVSGAGVGLAAAIAILASLRLDRPASRRGLASRLAAAAASGWGLVATMGYFAYAYKDPLLYVHAHQQAYAWLEDPLVEHPFEAGFFVRKVLRQHGHEGVWLVFGLLWLGLGLRPALRRFDGATKLFWYTVAASVLAVSTLGSWRIGFLGLNRYWLLVLPLFFAIAQATRRRPFARTLWIAFCLWSYWNVELTDYLRNAWTY